MWQENASSAELPSGDAREEVLGASKADGGGDVVAGRTRGPAAALEGFARGCGVAQGGGARTRGRAAARGFREGETCGRAATRGFREGARAVVCGGARGAQRR
ncbi:hypothetical protein GUJ93_ZPchr0014g47353 [Zizania palustris]|uniref:Uncharacterized protein n=1 Tax=Zizania palustris TaxID=103762 RepID=A0A8J5VUS1_ZIZPA|nr:hypothetical protein GUJ93_ZPchr0014g47353 [Zizania palustris]